MRQSLQNVNPLTSSIDEVYNQHSTQQTDIHLQFNIIYFFLQILQCSVYMHVNIHVDISVNIHVSRYIFYINLYWSTDNISIASDKSPQICIDPVKRLFLLHLIKYSGYHISVLFMLQDNFQVVSLEKVLFHVTISKHYFYLK